LPFASWFRVHVRSDVPEILRGCDWIVEPENPRQLVKTVKYILSYLIEALEMGSEAREKCEREYR